MTKQNHFLTEKLQKLQSNIEHRDVLSPSVSKASVAWHIDHSLKVINNICAGLHQSDPANYKPKIGFIKTVVMTTGWFPRGRSRAPKIALPPEEIKMEDIEAQLQQAHKNCLSILNLPQKSYFKHPIFGHMNKKQTQPFLNIHTHHHLKIIRDILKRQE